MGSEVEKLVSSKWSSYPSLTVMVQSPKKNSIKTVPIRLDISEGHGGG